MKFSLIRADDQVHLDVETFNLEPQRVGNGYELRPVTAGQPGHIALAFPKQHVMERVGTLVAKNPPQSGPIYSAGGTRVVFLVPAGHPPVPFTVAGILGALPGLALVTDGSVSPVAEPQGPPAALQASAAELVLDAMGITSNGTPEGQLAALPAGASRGAAETAGQNGHNGAPFPPLPGSLAGARSTREPSGRGAPGEALLAELKARALARRRDPDTVDLLEAPAPVLALASAPSGGDAGPAPHGTARAARAAAEPAPAAAPATAATAGAPGVTAMGFPSKLSLSVAGGATRMAHAAQPVNDGGNVELWHSRLSRRTTSGKLVELPTSFAAFRVHAAIETSDVALSDGTIKSVLDTSVQDGIAKQTTGPQGVPATARRLWVSPLGAWLDARGTWSGAVQGWRHRMVMGRDHYVQVVQKGRLYPLGHDAELVSTMERTNPTRNGHVAPLVRQDTIRVTQATRDYGAPADEAGRKWPWQTVELLTLESPAGVRKDVFPPPTTPNVARASYLEVGGLPYRFDCQATDRGNRVATFDLPLLFVPDSFTNFSGLSGWFGGSEAQGLGFRGIELDGQVVALAPSGGGTPPDTTTVVAHSAPLTVATGGSLGFRPVLPHVDGVIPSLARFAAAGGAPQKVSLAGPYLLHGFNPTNNPGEALFAFAGPAVGLGAGDTGGMVTPSFNISGLSRKVGLVGGNLSDVASGTFNVQNCLAGALDQFKLFGVFKLTDLIPTGLALGKDAPRMVTQSLDGLLTQELRWEVPLFGHLPKNELSYTTPLGVARLRRTTQSPLPGTDGVARLLVHLLAQPKTGTQQVHTSTLCQLTNLELVLELGGDEIVTLPLPLFEFKTVDGDKPDVNVKMGKLGFGGILRFVETLASLVDHEGLSDPPAIEQLPNGVRSSFTAPIPGVAVGAFSLENIVFGAALTLTFGSPLALALSFSTRDNPFQCTVSALGGGGWLELVLTTNGLQTLMGSLQFGAALSVKLGVASGSVSVMGGIEFFIDGSKAVLTGFLRVRGEVQVLGLISICIESTLALTYNSGNGKLEGSCEWVLRVKVVFIRKTVKVRFEKRFAGANGDPTFAELMAPAGATEPLPWDLYCGAYAED